MPSRACGFCGVHAHFSPVGTTFVTFEEPDGFGFQYVQSAFRCAACDLVTMAMTDIHPEMPGYKEQIPVGAEEQYWNKVGVDSWLPGNDGPKIQNLPNGVATASADAYKSYKSSVYTAAVLMARTTIEATAKHHGIGQGTLLKKIDQMHADGLILESTKLAAHAIRLLGNDMAHGDLEVSMGRDVATDVMELMHLILREVFELPFLAANLQKRAAERNQKTQTPQVPTGTAGH